MAMDGDGSLEETQDKERLLSYGAVGMLQREDKVQRFKRFAASATQAEELISEREELSRIQASLAEFTSQTKAWRNAAMKRNRSTTQRSDRPATSAGNEDANDLQGLSDLNLVLQEEGKVYDLFFSEVIRQVAGHCKQRGRFLQDIRSHYVELFSDVKDYTSKLLSRLSVQKHMIVRLAHELQTVESRQRATFVELRIFQNRFADATKQLERSQLDLGTSRRDYAQAMDRVQRLRDVWAEQKATLLEEVAALREAHDDMLSHSVALEAEQRKSAKLESELAAAKSTIQQLEGRLALEESERIRASQLVRARAPCTTRYVQTDPIDKPVEHRTSQTSRVEVLDAEVQCESEEKEDEKAVEQAEETLQSGEEEEEEEEVEDTLTQTEVAEPSARSAALPESAPERHALPMTTLTVVDRSKRKSQTRPSAHKAKQHDDHAPTSTQGGERQGEDSSSAVVVENSERHKRGSKIRQAQPGPTGEPRADVPVQPPEFPVDAELPVEVILEEAKRQEMIDRDAEMAASKDEEQRKMEEETRIGLLIPAQSGDHLQEPSSPVSFRGRLSPSGSSNGSSRPPTPKWVDFNFIEDASELGSAPPSPTPNMRRTPSGARAQSPAVSGSGDAHTLTVSLRPDAGVETVLDEASAVSLSINSRFLQLLPAPLKAQIAALPRGFDADIADKKSGAKNTPKMTLAKLLDFVRSTWDKAHGKIANASSGEQGSDTQGHNHQHRKSARSNLPPFPEFFLMTVKEQFGMNSLVDKHVLEVVTAVEHYREVNQEVNLFAELLEEKLSQTEFLLLLRARNAALVAKQGLKLPDAAISKAMNQPAKASSGQLVEYIDLHRAAAAAERLFPGDKERTTRENVMAWSSAKSGRWSDPMNPWCHADWTAIVSVLRGGATPADADVSAPASGSVLSGPPPQAANVVSPRCLPLLEFVELILTLRQRRDLEQEQGKWAAQLFDWADSDRKGYIDYRAFNQILSHVEPTMTQREVRQLFTNIGNAGETMPSQSQSQSEWITRPVFLRLASQMMTDGRIFIAPSGLESKLMDHKGSFDVSLGAAKDVQLISLMAVEWIRFKDVFIHVMQHLQRRHWWLLQNVRYANEDTLPSQESTTTGRSSNSTAKGNKETAGEAQGHLRLLVEARLCSACVGRLKAIRLGLEKAFVQPSGRRAVTLFRCMLQTMLSYQAQSLEHQQSLVSVSKSELRSEFASLETVIKKQFGFIQSGS